MERESFKSRLGFLLVSAGCAVGIGNVWRFPFIVGQNGGGLFVLLYLIMLVVLGLPVLTMELAVGRASRKSAVLAYRALEKPGAKWHIHGWFALLGCYLLMMYYTNVSGWMLNYFFKFATGVFQPGMDAAASGKVFSDMLADPGQMGLWMAVTVVSGVLICSVGVRKGLERMSKVMMSALFVLILIFQWLYILFQFLVSTLVCKENKFKSIKNIAPAYFTALGTQSSASTIPVNLDSAKKNGVSEDVANFVIPLCATIHLAGDTICLVLGAMGILMANGMTPTLSMFAPFILMLGVTMVAAPGVPGGGVMAALGLITSMLGFTEPMSQLIISLHFSQDSFGTACNITGDQAIAFVVDKADRAADKKADNKTEE